jgi:hypothetical protein
MASVKLMFLLGFCTFSMVPSSVDCQDGLANSMKQAALDAHNTLRGKVNKPQAANMEIMVSLSLLLLMYTSLSSLLAVLQTWNDNLAELAQSYADKCVYRHNRERHNQQSDFSRVGENMYASTAQPTSFSVAVQSWYDEVSDYTYETKTCLPGKVCGHYTQVKDLESCDYS